MYVLIDARRKINSGVGRVSQWVAQNVPFLLLDKQCKFLVTSDHRASDYYIDPEDSIICDIKPFSEADFYELPTFIDSLNADLYITPQTTWSPYIKTPSITMIHDLWALQNPEWLPSEEDVMHRFQLDNTAYLDGLINWLAANPIDHLLTHEGLQQFQDAVAIGNKMHLGVWAQYAAMINYSAITVTVSSYIYEQVCRLFRIDKNVVRPIPNVASNYMKGSYNKRSGEILLTLSKIESRKNLHYLLDEYTIYATERNPPSSPLPLVIAGDVGYKSEYEKIHQRITQLTQAGLDITLLPPVADKQLTALFAKAACIVFPTHFEGFGLPALEALLSEVPVICTATGIMHEDLRDYGHIIDGNVPKQLAQQIQQVVQQPPSQQALQEAKAAAMEYINLGNSLQLWGDIIHELLPQQQAVSQ